MAVAGAEKEGWRWPLGLAAGLFVLGGLPYLWGLHNEDAQHLFWGYLHFQEDMDSYAAFVNQAKSGAWLFANPYLVPAPSVYLNVLWLFLGNLAALGGLSFAVVFQVLRALAALVLALGFWRLGRAFGLLPRWRVYALLLYLLGAGAGWLFFLKPFEPVPLDIYTELFPFVALLAVPHAALAVGLLLWALSFFPEAATARRSALSAGLLLALLSAFRPYDALLGLGVWGLWSAWRIVAQRREARQGLATLALGLAPSLPLLAYQAWTTQASAAFGHWAANNHYPAPPVLALLCALGLLLPLALLALFLARRELLSARVLGPGAAAWWLLVAFLALFSGLLPFAWRTSASLSAPLVLLTVGLFVRLRSARLAAVLAALLLLLSLPSNVFFLVQKCREVGEQFRYDYTQPELLQAFAAIERDARCRLVFTHGHIGLKVPAYSSAHSLLGHKDLERDHAALLADYETVVKSQDVVLAGRVLARRGVDCILWGPLDQAAGAFQPGRLPDFRETYRNGLYTLYTKAGR